MTDTKMHDADEFADLLARIQAGDEAAMETLMGQYQNELLRIARVRLGAALRPYLDSIDLVQSVHKSILVGIRAQKFDLQSPEHLLRLTAMMLRRKIARKWKRHQRQIRLERSAGQVSDNQSLSYLILHLTAGMEDPAEQADLNERVMVVLGQLEPLDRRLIELRLAGFSTAEAARQMDLNPDVLRARLGRLRQRLQASRVAADWI